MLFCWDYCNLVSANVVIFGLNGHFRLKNLSNDVVLTHARILDHLQTFIVIQLGDRISILVNQILKFWF